MRTEEQQELKTLIITLIEQLQKLQIDKASGDLAQRIADMTESFERLALLMERHVTAAEGALAKMEAHTDWQMKIGELEAEVTALKATIQSENQSTRGVIRHLVGELGLPLEDRDGSTS